MIILCEGTEQSFDCILLNKLFCSIKTMRVVAVGSRFGMKLRIDTVRKVCDNKVYGILDRDFPEEWKHCGDSPLEWVVTENEKQVLYGWFWQRKELENYLLDPAVIKKTSLGKTFPFDDYQQALERARDRIGFYQAARIALSVLGRSGQYYVPSSFGPRRGSKENYRFPEDQQLTENECEKFLDGVHEEYLSRHSNRFATLQNAFQKYSLQCSEGGCRYEDFFYAFSGKDLAWSMNDWFAQNGFQGTREFLKRMLREILMADNALAFWLPEWTHLHEILSHKQQ